MRDKFVTAGGAWPNNHSHGIHPGARKQPLRDPDPIRVRFRAWARNRTRMSEEGRLAGRFPRDESRGYDCFGWPAPAPDVGVRSHLCRIPEPAHCYTEIIINCCYVRTCLILPLSRISFIDSDLKHQRWIDTGLGNWVRFAFSTKSEPILRCEYWDLKVARRW